MGFRGAEDCLACGLGRDSCLCELGVLEFGLGGGGLSRLLRALRVFGGFWGLASKKRFYETLFGFDTEAFIPWHNIGASIITYTILVGSLFYGIV